MLTRGATGRTHQAQPGRTACRGVGGRAAAATIRVQPRQPPREVPRERERVHVFCAPCWQHGSLSACIRILLSSKKPNSLFSSKGSQYSHTQEFRVYVSGFRIPTSECAECASLKGESGKGEIAGPFRVSVGPRSAHTRNVWCYLCLCFFYSTTFTETRKTSPDPDTRPHDHWGRYVQMILTTSYVTDLYSPRAPAQQVTVM